MEKIRILIKEFAIILCGGMLGYMLGYMSYIVMYADMITQASTETSYLLKIMLDVEIKESREVYTAYGTIIGMGLAATISTFFHQLKKD